MGTTRGPEEEPHIEVLVGRGTAQWRDLMYIDVEQVAALQIFDTNLFRDFSAGSADHICIFRVDVPPWLKPSV